MLVDRQIPGLARLVPAGILWPNDPVSQTGPELVEESTQDEDASRTRMSAYGRPNIVRDGRLRDLSPENEAGLVVTAEVDGP
jgi:hypothetical protein